MSEGLRANRLVYAGLFLIALATLMYEILLTRIFSVTMLYHFAFMAISVAMFGMTAGATIVFLFPRAFSAERVPGMLAFYSLLFGPSIVLSFIFHLRIPFIGIAPDKTMWSLVLIYATVTVPFIFSGICTCLALTKFPMDTGRLYAADLTGAALGCVLLMFVMNILPGPTAVLATGFIASLAAVVFCKEAGFKGMQILSALTSLALLLVVSIAPWLNSDSVPLLRLPSLTAGLSGRPLFEVWNSHSRVRVDGDPNAWLIPNELFLSPAYPKIPNTHQLIVSIDLVPTIMTAYNNDPATINYLKYDISNFAHHLRPDSNVLVIGVGGGRDILSALEFNQKSVVGVEVNKDVLKADNQAFGDFSGHLDRDPRVTFVNDDGRSFVARSKKSFDIIQISFIDTFAATAAGAFVLCENALYTSEAWKSFIDHLSNRGILSVNRWYFRNPPGEMLRATALASTALRQLHVSNPRDHIIVLRHMFGPGMPGTTGAPEGFGALLVSKSGFTTSDLEKVEKLTHDLQFELVMSPKTCIDPDFARVATTEEPHEFVRSYPINIAAPSDDSPFFFQMLRLGDIFFPQRFNQGAMSFNMQAVGVLALLIGIVFVLNLIFVVAPLFFMTDKEALKGSLPITCFFLSIGLGFMFIEISLMQRLIIFLGHPTYSLSVVLFTLLLAGGTGSFICDLLCRKNVRMASVVCLSSILISIVCVGLVGIPQLVSFVSAGAGQRIILVAALLTILGIPMGSAFPLGMRLALGQRPALAPWLWGLNGAASVTASVLSLALALTLSISTVYWLGALLYAAAALSYALSARAGAALTK